MGKGFGFLFEMGCGKTLTAIATAGAMYEAGKIRRVLVVAPTSVCPVWPADLDRFAGFTHFCAVLLGDKKKRLQALRDLSDQRGLQIAVINYESTHREGIFEALLEWRPDLVIADESQRIKTHNAAQSKALHALGDQAPYKLILSGTPVQNGAADLYSQYRFMDSSVFGSNFYAFRNRFCRMGGYQQKQIVGYKDMDALIRKEASVSYRVTKDECLDLPEQTFERRYVALNGPERRIYDEICKNSVAELEAGKITAATVLTRILRLQQLTGGFLQLDEARAPISVNRAKLDALEDILDDYVLETGRKLVIFAKFTAEIMAISELLIKKKIGFGLIAGSVATADRGGIVEDFQTNPETKVFLAQIQTAGLGITLHAADVAVFYSLDYNYANYSQAVARIHRIGQKNRCTYIHLMVERSIDDKIMAALESKEDLAKTVVDGWRNYF